MIYYISIFKSFFQILKSCSFHGNYRNTISCILCWNNDQGKIKTSEHLKWRLQIRVIITRKHIVSCRKRQYVNDDIKWKKKWSDNIMSYIQVVTCCLDDEERWFFCLIIVYRDYYNTDRRRWQQSSFSVFSKKLEKCYASLRKSLWIQSVLYLWFFLNVLEGLECNYLQNKNSTSFSSNDFLFHVI